MKRIIIRTFGGKSFGYGHYFRCLSLAKAIKSSSGDNDILFLINRDLKELIVTTGFNYVVSDNLEDDFDVVREYSSSLFIFDSYIGNDKYLKSIKEGTRLMLIDDNNDIYDSSIPDIIYNGNIHSEDLGYKDIKGQLKLLGTKYLIMKEEYWNNEGRHIPKDGLLITTGGTDKYGMALRILEEIKDLDLKKTIIIGPGYEDKYIDELEKVKGRNIELIYRPRSLKEHINSCKIVITAGGSTVYEVLSRGSIPMVFSIADNQDILCKALEEMGIEYLGKYPHMYFDNLGTRISRIQNEEISKYSDIFKLVDGQGAINTARAIISYIDRRLP
ncbi:MAG: hypothetical protein WCX96_03000 [Bacilli bacterium]